MRQILFLVIVLNAYTPFAQDKFITIYFPFNGNQPELSERLRLLYFLSDSLDPASTYKIEIKGYCDFIDSDTYNNHLSQERADNIKAIITSNGFSESSIALCKGFGEKTASAVKNSEQERQLQRRVEIQFICDCKNSIEVKPEIKEVITADDDNYFVDDEIVIDAYDVGDKFALGNLNFYGGRHKLLPESIPALKNLLQVLEENPTLRIMIIGHICCEDPNVPDGYDYDTKSYNLSLNRAKEVYDYLIKNGIDRSRLKYKGVGPSQKIYLNELTEQQRIANRRVEIEILEL